MMEQKAFFHNCLFVEEAAGGLIPRRFTQPQQEYWDSMGEVRAARARSCAGITLRAVTSAEEVSFSYQILSHCGEKLAFDLYENGRLTDSVVHLASGGRGNVCFRRVFSGEGEVLIYLPFTAELLINNLDFGEGGRAVSPDIFSGRVLWLGDSISQGMHASHPSQTLTAILGRRWNMEIINQGVGGCGFKDICRDFLYGDWKPEKMVILLGTNDTGPALTQWDTYSQRLKGCLEEICNIFQPENIRMITPFWRADCIKPEIGEPFEKICGLIRGEGRRLGIPLTEGAEVSPHCGDFYYDLRLHPNDMGFAAIGEALQDLYSIN